MTNNQSVTLAESIHLCKGDPGRFVVSRQGKMHRPIVDQIARLFVDTLETVGTFARFFYEKFRKVLARFNGVFCVQNCRTAVHFVDVFLGMKLNTVCLNKKNSVSTF